jgi:hypothetical protein
MAEQFFDCKCGHSEKYHRMYENQCFVVACGCEKFSYEPIKEEQVFSD